MPTPDFTKINATAVEPPIHTSLTLLPILGMMSSVENTFACWNIRLPIVLALPSASCWLLRA